MIARIHADAARRGGVDREALAATRHHQAIDTPLPADLSLRGVSQLLQQVGLQVSRRFQDLFRDTAILMRMGRNQGMARLAATRQQQRRNVREAQAPYSKAPESKPSDTSSDRPDDKADGKAGDNAANNTADEVSK